MRDAPVSDVHGPFIHAPLWGWEVATYFWLGGIASGSAFVSLACDAAGDHRSAAIARKVALGAVAPAPVLLIADLGRPGAFPEHDEDLQATLADEHGCLVPARLQWLGRAGRRLRPVGLPRTARRLGALTALFGSYLGSYTGVLLACTAVPLWSRSRTILGPAFVATATATGAAATRLVLVASGLPHGHPTRRALGTIETAAMLTELSISAFGERRLGDVAQALDRGRPGVYFRTAKSLVALGSRAPAGCAPHRSARARTRERHLPRGGSALPLRLGLCRKGFRERRRGRGGGTRPFSVPRGPWASMARACPVAPAFPVAAAQCGSPCVR